MSAKSETRITLLFDDELREAAKALRALAELHDDAPYAEYNAASLRAVNACVAALMGADDDGAILMLGRKIDFMRVNGKEPDHG